MPSSTPKKIYLYPAGAICVIAIFYVMMMLALPAPKPTIQLNIQSGSINTGQPAKINWPGVGSGAIGSPESVTLDSYNDTAVRPTASMAKIILALAVLKQKPINPGQSGPLITLTAEDKEFYNFELQRGGSTVPVVAGEQLSEYQALQGLLVPSGNNIASTLAVWAFGSKQAYINYANNMLRDMKLTHTTIADTSGFSPETSSTAKELASIAAEAAKSPVISEIVSQKSATIANVQLTNTNSALGLSGINGIKTGYSDLAGDCLLFSAQRRIGASDVRLVGVLMGQPGTDGATSAAPEIVAEAFQNFVTINIATAGQTVGKVSVPWAAASNVKTQGNIELTVWKGTQLGQSVTTQPAMSGNIGTIKVSNKSTTLYIESALPAPSPMWRLTHPTEMIKG